MGAFTEGIILLLIKSCQVINKGMLSRWRFVGPSLQAWRVPSCCSPSALPYPSWLCRRVPASLRKPGPGAGGVKGSAGGVAAADKEQFCV